MLILGLLLIIGASALTIGAVYDGGESASVELLGATVNTTVAGVFFTGAATMLLFLIGVWLLSSSMGRARRKRMERKEVKRRHRDSVTRLEEERTQLRAENERLNEQLGQTRPAAGTATAEGSTTTRHEPVRGPDPDTTPPSHDAPANDATSAEGGAHARHDTDLRQAETSSASRSRDGQI